MNKQGKVGLLVVLATTIRLQQSLVEYAWAVVFPFCQNVLAYCSDDDDVRNVINSSS